MPISARGLATGDYDNDGDLDFLVVGIDAPPMLMRNDSTGLGHWLKFRLLNRNGSPALNALVTVSAGGTTQVRELRSGSTYQSQNSMILHFGLGAATTVDPLRVRWLDGTTETRRSLQSDELVTIIHP